MKTLLTITRSILLYSPRFYQFWKIKPKITTGQDDIPVFILKGCAPLLHCPCASYSWQVEAFKISSGHKKRPKNDVTNYHPVTVIWYQNTSDNSPRRVLCNFIFIFFERLQRMKESERMKKVHHRRNKKKLGSLLRFLNMLRQNCGKQFYDTWVCWLHLCKY